jgi:hypothetical protein
MPVLGNAGMLQTIRFLMQIIPSAGSFPLIYSHCPPAILSCQESQHLLKSGIF